MHIYLTCGEIFLFGFVAGYALRCILVILYENKRKNKSMIRSNFSKDEV
jgi:hypothetical protein